MHKKNITIVLPIFLILLLSGCLFRPPDELYKRPERSAEYHQLVSAIQAVRTRLQEQTGGKCEDAVIVSGDHIASIQLQDLDGDGRRESAVVFLRVPVAEKSLKIFIFKEIDEMYYVAGIIEGDGSAIYSIEYADLNGSGQKEIVVNWQVSAGVYQLGAYTLDELDLSAQNLERDSAGADDWTSLYATELLLTSCSPASEGSGNYSSGYRLLDIDQDTRTEIAVAHMDAGGLESYVEIFGWSNGTLESMAAAELSKGATTLNRLRAGFIRGEYCPPALYVSCTLADGTKSVDVLGYTSAAGEAERQLVNLSMDPETKVSRSSWQGYTDISPTDINGDMVQEVPLPMPLPSFGEKSAVNFWLIEWKQYSESGEFSHVLTTYHNISDGWYLVIPEQWKDKLTISRNDALSGQRQVNFSLWQGEDKKPEPFLSIFRLTGSNRTTRAVEDGRFILHEEGEIIYAAKFYDVKWSCGLSENELITENFQTIQTNWNG